jgi:pimeloyl-ACP methyl ester carboxylesterase
LIEVSAPRGAEAAVLVLHGGASRGRAMPVSPAQLSVLRMIPIARALARAGRGRLAVYRLLNSRRGWDAAHTPVDDARWALGEIGQRPVGVVGHSLGGRAALALAPEVESVVALNPWVYPDDGRAGGRALIVHGSEDRVASPQRAEAVARRTGATFVTVEGGEHAMLSHSREFLRPTVDWVLDTLL